MVVSNIGNWQHWNWQHSQNGKIEHRPRPPSNRLRLHGKCARREAVGLPEREARTPRRGRKGPRQHRSVYFAERMAERLAGLDGVELEVIHGEESLLETITKLKGTAQ